MSDLSIIPDGNLVLGRKRNESIVIDLREFGLGLIEVTNIEIRSDKVRLGLRGQRRIKIHRREVFDRIERGNAA